MEIMEKEQTDVTNYDITPDSLTPISSGELELCRQWVEKKKLEEEIRTGVKLQHAKPKFPYTRELHLVDIKSKKRPSPIPTEVKNRSRNAKTLPATKKLPSSSKTGSCNTKCKTDNCQTRKYKDCPTRIIELATPSKRHCLETWRNRSSTLPPLMLERLKKYVNDEAPVIPIGDAITCFQRKKSKPKKKPKVKSVFITERDKLEYRNISSIFGSKIVRKLMKPMKIQLKDKWQRVADNIQYDTAKLMRKCCTQTKFGTKMNKEIANKVTIWIATILDESEMKLLDDELAELNEVEGPVIAFIEELIDQAIAIVNKKINANYSDVSFYEFDDETSSYTNTEKSSEGSIKDDAKEIKDVIRLVKPSKTLDEDKIESNNIQAEESDDNIASVFKEAITELIDSIENNFVDAFDVLEALPEAMNKNTDIDAADKPIHEPEFQETIAEISKENTEMEDMNVKDDVQEIDTAGVNVFRDVSRSGSEKHQLAENLNINTSDDNADTVVLPEVKIPDITIEIEANLLPTDVQNIEKDMNKFDTQHFNVNAERSTENNITDISTTQSASKAEADYEINESPSNEKNIVHEDIESNQLQQDVDLSWKNSETNLLDENIIQSKQNFIHTNFETNRIDYTDKQENVDDLTTDSILKLLTDTSQPNEKVDKSATNSMRNLPMESTSPPQEILDKLPSNAVTQVLMDNTRKPIEKVDKSTTDSATQVLMDNTGQPIEKLDKSTTDSATQLLMDNTGQQIEKVDKSTTDSATQLLMDNTGQQIEKVDKSTTDSATQLLMDHTGQQIEKVDKSTTDSDTQLLTVNTGQPIEKMDKTITQSVTQLLMKDNTGQPFEKVDKSTTDSVKNLPITIKSPSQEILDKLSIGSVTNLLDEIQAQEELDMSSTGVVLKLEINDVEIEEMMKMPRSYSELIMLADKENYDQQEEATWSTKLEIKLFTETEERRVSSADADITSTDSEMKLLVKNLSRPYQSIESSIMSVTDFLGKHIHFSTPKPELLTKVDEIWPEELSRTKITANITKSITSLGNIREYFADEDEIKISSTVLSTVKPDLDKAVEKVEKVIEVEKVVEPIKKVTKPDVEQNIEVEDDVSAKGDSNIQLVPIKQITFEYKVNPETAPVWLKDYISDPNAKGLKVSKSSPTNEQCTNLYEAYSIMENWSKWLQKTCENIERLKNNEVSFGENRIKDWAQLKNHIDYDIARWKIFCAKTKTATRRIQSKPSCKCSIK